MLLGGTIKRSKPLERAEPCFEVILGVVTLPSGMYGTYALKPEKCLRKSMRCRTKSPKNVTTYHMMPLDGLPPSRCWRSRLRPKFRRRTSLPLRQRLANGFRSLGLGASFKYLESNLFEMRWLPDRRDQPAFAKCTKNARKTHRSIANDPRRWKNRPQPRCKPNVPQVICKVIHCG